MQEHTIGSNGKSGSSTAINLREDFSEHLAAFLATNPYRCTTFGKTVDLVNNPENIPAFAQWMTKVVKDSLEWERSDT